MGKKCRKRPDEKQEFVTPVPKPKKLPPPPPPPPRKKKDGVQVKPSRNNVMTNAKYRKRPVEIEAFEYNGVLIDTDVPDWAIEAFDKGVIHFADGFEMYIKTLEGDMLCSVGDYIIKEPFPTDDRTVYPCKPDIFWKTYEAVEG